MSEFEKRGGKFATDEATALAKYYYGLAKVAEADKDFENVPRRSSSPRT